MNRYFCPVCSASSLTVQEFVEAGTHSFYHHIRVELLACECGKKTVALYYFEEERHGHPESESHIGGLIDDDTFFRLQDLVINTPETLRSIPNAAPYKFKEFFPIPIVAEHLFAMKVFQEKTERFYCLEHSKSHWVLQP